jgi:DNA polymerase
VPTKTSRASRSSARGQLLTKIIEAINLRREDVYIANVIKCRPPQNRNPEPDEVEQCEPFLFRQIDAIKPKVIVALGKFAAQCLLKTTDPITRIRGREYRYRDAILMPTYHPAYLLRNPSSKREVWEDMKRVRELLGGRVSRPELSVHGPWPLVRFVAVAVPVPQLDALTYRVPEGMPMPPTGRGCACRSAHGSSPGASSVPPSPHGSVEAKDLRERSTTPLSSRPLSSSCVRGWPTTTWRHGRRRGRGAAARCQGAGVGYKTSGWWR